MPVCHTDATFTSDDIEDQRQAAALCRSSACPFILECREAGMGEEAGVYGGLTPRAGLRRAFRRSVDRKVNCPNGHPIKDYGWDIASGSEKPLVACRRCAALLLHIAEAEPGTPMPVTEKREYDGIQHGTEAGYKAHKRRGQNACVRCREAKNEARARQDAEREMALELAESVA